MCENGLVLIAQLLVKLFKVPRGGTLNQLKVQSEAQREVQHIFNYLYKHALTLLFCVLHYTVVHNGAFESCSAISLIIQTRKRSFVQQYARDQADN